MSRFLTDIADAMGYNEQDTQPDTWSAGLSLSPSQSRRDLAGAVEALQLHAPGPTEAPESCLLQQNLPLYRGEVSFACLLCRAVLAEQCAFSLST